MIAGGGIWRAAGGIEAGMVVERVGEDEGGGRGGSGRCGGWCGEAL